MAHCVPTPLLIAQPTSGHPATRPSHNSLKCMNGRVCSVFLPPRSLHIHSSVDASAAMALRSGRGFQRYAQSRDRVGSVGPEVHTGHPGMPVPRSITEDPLRMLAAQPNSRPQAQHAAQPVHRAIGPQLDHPSVVTPSPANAPGLNEQPSLQQAPATVRVS